MPRGQPNAFSSKQQLQRSWFPVCVFIDAEPLRSLWFPFHSVVPHRTAPPISARLLERMARFGLIQHRATDCAWRLSPRWKTIFRQLLSRAPDEALPTPPKLPTDPFLVDFGVDTMYVNVLAEALPAALVANLTDFKQQAQAEDNTVLTPWVYDGAPLSMFKSGKGTTDKHGVSWGYILRNEGIEIKLRKTAVSGIVVMVRLGAQPLWLKGAKPALDMMRSVLKSLWGGDDFDHVGFQLSQIHLCADIANFPLHPGVLSQIVSHSLSQTMHLHSVEDLAAPTISYDEDDPYLYDDPPDAFDPQELVDQDEWLDDDDDEEETDDATAEPRDDDDDHPGWAEGGAGVHFFGKHIQGFSFSPRSPLSAAWYDKAREEQKSRKHWMRPIHEAGGWQVGMALTRTEFRFKRGVTRELDAALGHRGEHWFDDPWVAILHVGDLWGFAVGLPPEHDQAPDVTHRGWMRLTLPAPSDETSTRWDTDPVWLIVQRVPFASLPVALKRVKHVVPDLDHIDAELYGLLKTRAVLRGVYLLGDAELPRELEAFDDRMADWMAERGNDFNEEVRERARMMGKPLPLRPAGVLPPSVRRHDSKKVQSA